MCCSRGESRGGENGPGIIAVTALTEFARWVRAFSALSARKKNSSGDSSFRDTCGGVVASSESVDGGESSCPGAGGPVAGFTPGESLWDRAKKLGIGRAEGAGEA